MTLDYGDVYGVDNITTGTEVLQVDSDSFEVYDLQEKISNTT